MPSTLTETDKPSGILFQYRSLAARCDSADQALFRGLSDMSQLATAVVSAISCGSYGTVAIMLTAEGSLGLAPNDTISWGACACGSTIIPSTFCLLPSLLHSCLS